MPNMHLVFSFRHKPELQWSSSLHWFNASASPICCLNLASPHGHVSLPIGSMEYWFSLPALACLWYFFPVRTFLFYTGKLAYWSFSAEHKRVISWKRHGAPWCYACWSVVGLQLVLQCKHSWLFNTAVTSKDYFPAVISLAMNSLWICPNWRPKSDLTHGSASPVWTN